MNNNVIEELTEARDSLNYGSTGYAAVDKAINALEASSTFKFKPLDYVKVIPLDCEGRVNRCIDDGGTEYIYLVCLYLDGNQKFWEFYEDELRVRV